MKVKLNFLKIVTCTLVILPVISVLSLQAQDYQISFAGSGGSTTVDSVIVENLTTGTILKMKGIDVLHLMGTTGIETIGDDNSARISIYPNPMNGYSRIQFILPEQGVTTITLIDLSGKKIAQTKEFLLKGHHTYSIQGVEEGAYFITISCGRYSLSGKLISSGSKNGNAKIAYESSVISQEKQNDSKSTNEEKVMQYNTGDRLKLKGKSGIYSTIVIDVPTASKTITYNFIEYTDSDGNNYPIVQIGTVKGTKGDSNAQPDIGVQTWTAENLKTTKLNDGTLIPNVTDGTAWAGLTTSGYCWYNNNTGYKNIYGALYNGFTIATGKLCHLGWHIPTQAEWTVLTDYLGGAGVAGGKLKETETRHWNDPNTGATDESGFTALPGGGRGFDGAFWSMGIYGDWWSSSEGQPPSKRSFKYFWIISLEYDRSSSRGLGIDWSNGASVRCLKD
jgi:uncharacterized protein (TIGR02145 family)